MSGSDDVQRATLLAIEDSFWYLPQPLPQSVRHYSHVAPSRLCAREFLISFVLRHKNSSNVQTASQRDVFQNTEHN